MLAFDPARFSCTALGRTLGEYTFFRYYPSEMLHLSVRERSVVIGCMEDIHREAERKEDHFSRRVLSGLITLLLDHCVRFYERQFITRSLTCRSQLAAYEVLLTRWIESGKLRAEGLPSEPFCADSLALSPDYFRSLLQFETGKTHTEYMQAKRVETARQLLSDADSPVSEIASLLGFPSEQCFNRFFKKVTGCLPDEYRHVC